MPLGRPSPWRSRIERSAKRGGQCGRMGHVRESDIVWQSAVDDRYRVTVVRTAPYRGALRIEDREVGWILHEEEVSLSYDAMFGPDLADVGRWQEITVQVVERGRDGPT